MKTITGKKDDKRPTFKYNNKPVRAAGLLVYCTLGTQRYYLLRSEKKGRWSDIGGKTDEVDEDIISVVVREVTEETNNHLFSCVHDYSQAYTFLDSKLREDELQIHYCPKGKYILLKVEFDSKYKDMSNKRFGLKEKTDGWAMDHYYSWVPANRIQRHKLHPRLRYHTDYYNLF